MNIFKQLKTYYEQKTATIVERYQFHKWDQVSGETITEYDAAFRKLATHCVFADYLEEALRDRFFCGLRDNAIQRRLFSREKPHAHERNGLSHIDEAAEKNTRSVKSQDATIKQIHGGQRPVKSHTQQPCSRCWKTNHAAKDCKFKDATCHACGKRGHIAPACRSNPAMKPQVNQQPRSTPHGGTHLIQQAPSDDSDTEKYYRFRLSAPAANPIEVTVHVEGKPLIMELDTGAAMSIISEDTRRKILPQVNVRKSKII